MASVARIPHGRQFRLSADPPEERRTVDRRHEPDAGRPRLGRAASVDPGSIQLHRAARVRGEDSDRPRQPANDRAGLAVPGIDPNGRLQSGGAERANRPDVAGTLPLHLRADGALQSRNRRPQHEPGRQRRAQWRARLRCRSVRERAAQRAALDRQYRRAIHLLPRRRRLGTDLPRRLLPSVEELRAGLKAF